MKLLISLMLGLLLVACGPITGKTKPVVPQQVAVTQYLPYECGTAPSLDPLVLKDVQWRVATVDGVQVFALSVPDYANLVQNDNAVLTRSKQVVGQRDFYRDCIERSKKITPPSSAAPRQP